MLTALVSVSDKTNLSTFLTNLKQFDELKLLATRSTATYLTDSGFSCLKIEELTQFPEILNGRVKTLHPKVFAGILSRPLKEDRDCLSEHGIQEIDLVIVNLYPFEAKLKEGLSEVEMIEQIDVGGVSLLRAAAKNFKRVTVICEPWQYNPIIDALNENHGTLSEEFRKTLALASFKHTADYDRKIALYFSRQLTKDSSIGASIVLPTLTTFGADMSTNDLPPAIDLKLSQFQSLRYGENPHQAATWYAEEPNPLSKNGLGMFPPFEQLQGKELSSNNITDTYCLVRILRDIGSPASCIIKHNNPCGVAVGSTLDEAFDKAYLTDPSAAFGGIYGLTGKVTEDLAKTITAGFVEIVAAPEFDSVALNVFKSKKNLRVLRLKPDLLKSTAPMSWYLRHLQDFGFIMEKDIEPPVKLAQFQCVAGDKLKEEHIDDAAFAWAVVRHLTSNAIFIAKNGRSLGFGIGQTSRIASVNIALAQAGREAKGAVMASDAFFPATDSIEAAAKAGISVIIQPGGSLKDKEVIAACQHHGITMLLTGQRCFKH